MTKQNKLRWPFRALFVCGVSGLLWVAGCGGGSGGAVPNPTPQPQTFAGRYEGVIDLNGRDFVNLSVTVDAQNHVLANALVPQLALFLRFNGEIDQKGKGRLTDFVLTSDTGVPPSGTLPAGTKLILVLDLARGNGSPRGTGSLISKTADASSSASPDKKVAAPVFLRSALATRTFPFQLRQSAEGASFLGSYTGSFVYTDFEQNIPGDFTISVSRTKREDGALLLTIDSSVVGTIKMHGYVDEKTGIFNATGYFRPPDFRKPQFIFLRGTLQRENDVISGTGTFGSDLRDRGTFTLKKDAA